MLLAQYLSLRDIAVFISGQLYTDAACTNGRQKTKRHKHNYAQK